MGISGYVHEPERLVKLFSPVATEQQFLITHGTRDPLIPIERVRPQMEILRKAGLKIDWHEFAKQHNVAGEAEITVIRNLISARFGV